MCPNFTNRTAATASKVTGIKSYYDSVECVFNIYSSLNETVSRGLLPRTNKDQDQRQA